MSIICAFLTVYLVVLFCRVVLSWFPLRQGTVMAQVYSMLFEVTEPVVAPLRRVIPPVGMFDLSFMVLTFGILILRSALCG